VSLAARRPSPFPLPLTPSLETLLNSLASIAASDNVGATRNRRDCILVRTADDGGTIALVELSNPPTPPRQITWFGCHTTPIRSVAPARIIRTSTQDGWVIIPAKSRIAT
jgi:hypothetical protein